MILFDLSYLFEGEAGACLNIFRSIHTPFVYDRRSSFPYI
jgi:hypothetical protein